MADEIPNSALRFRWTRTWPELHRDNDFIARESDGRQICRVYRVSSGPQSGRWFWTAADHHKQLGEGYEDTAREAALVAEAAYFRNAG